MEKSAKFARTFEKFEKALKKFGETVDSPESFHDLDEEIVIELATKRFEYTFEACWKALQAYLRTEGVDSATPLKCFKGAYKTGDIAEQHDEIFLTMIEKRNQIVHVYDEAQAKHIYEFIKSPQVILAFQDVYDSLKSKL